jgi:hypothetical protein
VQGEKRWSEQLGWRARRVRAHTHPQYKYTHRDTSASVKLEALKDGVDMRETISRAR